MADDESLLPPTKPDSCRDEEQPSEEAKDIQEQPSEEAKDIPPETIEKKPEIEKAKPEIENAKPEIENDLALLFEEHNVPARFRTFIVEQGVKSVAAFAAT